jgi:class 3 adenylate cyclase
MKSDGFITSEINAAPEFYRGRLFRKYFLLILVLVCGTLLVSGGTSAYFSYQEHQATLASLQHEKASAAALRIDQFVRLIEQQLNFVALPQLGQGASGIEQRRFEFLKLLRQVPAVSDIAQLDANGREVLKVSRLEMDVVGSAKDCSQDPAFRGANLGKTWFGPVYFRKETEPYMTIAVRSRSGEGAVTVVEVNLKFIWDVVTSIRIGKKGKAYVVDSTGNLIADPDIGLVLGKTNLSRLTQVKSALAAQDAANEEAIKASDLAGAEVLTAYAGIEPLGWKVFVEQPVAEVYETLYAAIRRTGILLVAGMLFSVLTAFWLARGLVRPIRMLQAGAQKVGAGELDQKIEVNTGDELETLADQFNTMTERLRESYTGLERKVDERTAEVQRQAQELTEWNNTLKLRVAEGVRQIEHMGQLKRFLSPQIVDLIVSGPSEDFLKSHRREITVVFLDLRGFTAFTEKADPEEVMELLHGYHTSMGRLIMAYNGTIEHFAGDGIMIVFNDPVVIDNPAWQAVRMAVQMQAEFAGLLQTWKKYGYELHMGIGIAQGYATIGVIGFEDRRDYTAIGAVCNLSSRLCGEAKAGQILVAQKVYGFVEDRVTAEPVGELSLKGFHQPVPAFNITALK